MTHLYPTKYENIAIWAEDNQFGIAEAKERYAQYGILCAISSSKTLRETLVFKGGNALDFIWHPNRSTKDLDFSAISTISSEDIGKTFPPVLDQYSRESGVLYRLQSLKKNPPGEDKTFATYQLKVGYALPDANSRIIEQIKRGASVPEVIPIEISLNEIICNYTEIDFGANHLKTSTREDIFAEKLRALLQQIPRNRSRGQDLVDLTTQLQAHVPLNISLISEYLIKKAEARDIQATKSAFMNPEIFTRAAQSYEQLNSTTRNSFLLFLHAKELLLSFIKTLQIPE